jgi:hypothetical protein
MRTRGRSQRGQATTETILLTWIMVVFFAAAYQMFVVNDSIYKSVSAAHRELFAAAFRYNCADQGNSNCHYSRDRVVFVWDPMNLPETRVPTVPIFRRVTGLPDEVLIQNGPNQPKRSFVGTGTAGPGAALGSADVRLFRQAVEAALEAAQNLGALLDRFNG